jgi:RNA recognition motif-containing protein
MSRLIVKNIPAHVTPERLREHFTRRDGPGGTLTDVKVARKRDGTSRCFGFVGFKTDAEAAAAQRWFDRTFIGSARISVEIVDVRFNVVHLVLFRNAHTNSHSRVPRMLLLQDPTNVQG